MSIKLRNLDHCVCHNEDVGQDHSYSTSICSLHKFWDKTIRLLTSPKVFDSVEFWTFNMWRICTRCFEGGPLTHGSWWGNIVNRKPSQGGEFLWITLCWFDDLTSWLDKRIKQSNTLVKFHVCPTHKCRTLLFLILSLIDWCCFYYFVRNSLVALLEALCARIFSWDSWISGFSWHFFFGVCKVSNKAFLPPLLSRHRSLVVAISCVLIVHVCLCVCASVCACENV